MRLSPCHMPGTVSTWDRAATPRGSVSADSLPTTWTPRLHQGTLVFLCNMHYTASQARLHQNFLRICSWPSGLPARRTHSACWGPDRLSSKERQLTGVVCSTGDGDAVSPHARQGEMAQGSQSAKLCRSDPLLHHRERGKKVYGSPSRPYTSPKPV